MKTQNEEGALNRATAYQILGQHAHEFKLQSANGSILVVVPYDTEIRTTEASNVSESTRTTSLVSEKRGTAINRTT
jgi:hypothetical protein